MNYKKRKIGFIGLLGALVFFVGGCNKDVINEVLDTKPQEQTSNSEASTFSFDDSMFEGYEIVDVAACNLSGERLANVAVDIGYGDREYWAFTNEHGQLVKVVAKEIILQDDYKEDVNRNGRYCEDEARVEGTQARNYDQGHVIADSLGGVSNAYNITPQDSILNRHGDQAYMEKVIRQAGGCSDFVATITYPDTKTQIPNHYSFTYTLKGNVIHDDFDNVNPEKTVPGYNGVSEYYVWVSENGTKYHSKPNCSTIMKANVKKKSLENAKKEGYSPCKRCH